MTISPESETKADVPSVKHEKVSRMAANGCTATGSAHLHIISLDY